MGLDAHVFCNCYERGLLLSAPPPGCSLSVVENGGLQCNNDDLEVQIAFDKWLKASACIHENGHLVSHRIGNVAAVDSLREEFEQQPDYFKLILSRILYSGSHCGDIILASELSQLVPEVEALAGIHCEDPDMERFVRGFEIQMIELLNAALHVGKPIVF